MPVNYDKQNKKIARLETEISRLRDLVDDLKTSSEGISSVLDSTMHEVRRFTEDLTVQSEVLSDIAQSIGNRDVENRADTIFYTVGLITARLAYTDLELNPDAIKRQVPIRVGLYKKFDKARQILSAPAKKKHLKFEFSGASRTEIEALRAFELVPMAILDNALKYSPLNQNVHLHFEEELGKKVSVRIESIGPRLGPGEMEKIFDSGFRGENAIRATQDGFGLGLNLVKRICDLHGISVLAESDFVELYSVEGVPYAKFAVTLEWRR